MDSAQTIGTALCTRSPAGLGRIDLALVAGRTRVTRCRANSPLRLLTPQDNKPAARIIVGSYGGGLVGGDAIDLTVNAGDQTRCLISTQASTKIYRSDVVGCSQDLALSAGPEAIIVSLPDPVVCFADSGFVQRQQFDLAGSASLLMVDWFTSGRAARGERWAMKQYASRTEINVDGDCIFRDVLELDPTDGEIGAVMRMGRIDCFATAVMVGPAVMPHAEAIARALQRKPTGSDSSLLFGASALPRAVVLRVAGGSTEVVGRWLKEKLAFAYDLLGMDPWNRKW